MENLQHATIAYSVCLIILFFCILLIRIAIDKNKYIKYVRYIIRLIGVLPGFVGVLFGIYVLFMLNNRAGLAIMSGGLILEIGSVQLLYILKKYDQDLSVKPDPVNQ
ncbi:MAG: hypothetical protein ACR2NC_03560 [Thermodesulfobacteriota bacterium]